MARSKHNSKTEAGMGRGGRTASAADRPAPSPAWSFRVEQTEETTIQQNQRLDRLRDLLASLLVDQLGLVDADSKVNLKLDRLPSNAANLADISSLSAIGDSSNSGGTGGGK